MLGEKVATSGLFEGALVGLSTGFLVGMRVGVLDGSLVVAGLFDGKNVGDEVGLAEDDSGL